jgi:hypothetical protein
LREADEVRAGGEAVRAGEIEAGAEAEVAAAAAAAAGDTWLFGVYTKLELSVEEVKRGRLKEEEEADEEDEEEADV